MACPPRKGHAGGTRHGAFENIPADDPIRSTLTTYKKHTALPGRQAVPVKEMNGMRSKAGMAEVCLPHCLLPCSVISEFHTSVKLCFLKSPTTN